MQDTSCVPHARSHTSVPSQGSHSVQRGRTEAAALCFVWVSLQTWPQTQASTDTSVKPSSREQRMGTLSAAQTAGAVFDRTPPAPAGCICSLCTARSKRILRGSCSHPSLLKNWKGRKPSLSPIPGSQQDTASFCTFCSILLRLGVSVLTVLWKGETLQRAELLQRQPGTCRSTIHSRPYSDQKIGRNETCAILDKVLRAYKPSENRHQA